MGIGLTHQVLRQEVGDSIAGLDESGTIPVEQLPVMQGATAGTDGASGIVPAPQAGEDDEFLKGDATWDPV